MHLIIMPYLDCHTLTEHAVADCLAQTLPATVLLIDNGSQQTGREVGEEQVRAHPGRVLRWRHDPPLSSLSAVWNRALRFAWEAGCEEALVVNNDIRLHPHTFAHLAGVRRMHDALFVTATGVTPGQFHEFCTACPTSQEVEEAIWHVPGEDLHGGNPLPGPDFSCYLITKACHEKYPFDEQYIPAYCEDLDYHRRLMLGGDGMRIFGTGLPFLHLGSGTLTHASAEKRARLQQQIEQGSRAHHLRKWGGAANAEKLVVPFGETSAREGVATQELFARVRNGQPAL